MRFASVASVRKQTNRLAGNYLLASRCFVFFFLKNVLYIQYTVCNDCACGSSLAPNQAKKKTTKQQTSKAKTGTKQCFTKDKDTNKDTNKQKKHTNEKIYKQ